MTYFKAAALTGLLALLMAAPASAKEGNNGNHYGWFKGGGSGVSHSAPGPMIGIGLPGLAAYGLYVWYRRRQRR
jgi:hypothetical protein